MFLNSTDSKPLADEENAASWILRAAAIHKEIPWDDSLGRLSATPAERWKADDVRLARQYGIPGIYGSRFRRSQWYEGTRGKRVNFNKKEI